jgi:hypothetical protein
MMGVFSVREQPPSATHRPAHLISSPVSRPRPVSQMIHPRCNAALVRKVMALVLLLNVLTLAAAAQDLQGMCGDPPPVANESLKAEIEGEIQLLSRFLGRADITGLLETTRQEIFSNYPDAELTRSNAYLEYQVCIIIMTADNLSPKEKLDELLRARETLRHLEPVEDRPRGDTNTHFTTQVASASRSADSFTLSLVMSSEAAESCVIAYVPESGFLVDNAGAFCLERKVGGIASTRCEGIFFPQNYTVVTPGSKQTLIMNFR